MNSAELKVEGISCNHCGNTITGALKDINVAGKVDLAGKTVRVEYDENQVTMQTLKQTIENKGFKVL